MPNEKIMDLIIVSEPAGERFLMDLKDTEQVLDTMLWVDHPQSIEQYKKTGYSNIQVILNKEEALAKFKMLCFAEHRV